MKNKILLTVLLGLGVILFCGAVNKSQESGGIKIRNQVPDSTTTATNTSKVIKKAPIKTKNDFDLLKITKAGENKMLSPLSIDMALGMLANGFVTGDPSVDNLFKERGFKSLAEYNDYMSTILVKYSKEKADKALKSKEEYKSGNPPVVSFANSFWYVKDKRVVKPKFQQTLNSKYTATTKYINKK